MATIKRVSVDANALQILIADAETNLESVINEHCCSDREADAERRAFGIVITRLDIREGI